MKSIKTICSLNARPFAVCLSILLVGTILLWSGSGPKFEAEATSYPHYIETMEEYVEMGRVIVFGYPSTKVNNKMIGRGQCPLCHTFEPGDNLGRCPNLFGIEERSHLRIQEDRYLNEPISIGDMDKASGIVKGAPDQIPGDYRREGSLEITGEDYLRESLMCPSCYVVEGYGKAGDTKSPMPAIHKPPISLYWIKLNAVIAWLQSKDTPGDYSRVTVPLPTREFFERKREIREKEWEKQRKQDAVFLKTCDNPECVPQVINALGCSLCHTIPRVNAAVGELGPPLYMKINAPKRIKDPNYQGNARTAREYVKESILNPNIYIVFNETAGEPYPEGVMPSDYGKKLSPEALETLIDFISNTEPE